MTTYIGEDVLYMDDFIGLLQEIGAYEAIEQAWPGAWLADPRFGGDTDNDIHLRAVLPGGEVIGVGVGGELLRRAMTGCDVVLFIELLRSEIAALAERVAETGHMLEMAKLDPR